jgi:Schlafen, AlbA_2
MTDDFWSIALPNDLATSSPRSPSLFAYNAALVLLDARALFSKLKVADLLDPSIQAPRAAVERHHLFPKEHLKTLRVTEIRETNQIANFAFVEWGDNADISGNAPSEYLPPIKSRFPVEELKRMYRWHALPENWEQLDYPAFLEKRRDLMAEVIRDGYRMLTGERTEMAQVGVETTAELVTAGESDQVEFKSTLRINIHTGQKDARMETAVLKTIAGFLNTRGGRLIVGVRDDGTPVGIEADQFESEDKMGLHLVNLVNGRMGPQTMVFVHVRFDEYEDRRVMMIECQKSPKPVFLKDGETEYFYIRTGPSTTLLTPSQTQEYIQQWWR